MDFEVKIEKNREKNVSKKYVFFDCVFLSILGGFGEGFGRILGGIWRLLALLGSFLGVIFRCLYLECSLEGLLGPPGLDFGSIWRGLGRVWGGFWTSKIVYKSLKTTKTLNKGHIVFLVIIYISSYRRLLRQPVKFDLTFFSRFDYEQDFKNS